LSPESGQGEYAGAEPLLLEGYQGIAARNETIGASNVYHVNLARAWVLQLYQAWNKPDKAAAWRVAPASQP
jgi:hypothetical protein